MAYEEKQQSLCCSCNKYPIQNKFHKLCIICNKKRLDDSKTNKPHKKTNYRRAAANQDKKKAFRSKVFAQRPKVCQGCGSKNNLTLSHTIPVSLRKDLEFESDNVQIECMSCHTAWEHGDFESQKKLLNFNSKVKYIQLIDPQYYERRFNT